MNYDQAFVAQRILPVTCWLLIRMFSLSKNIHYSSILI